MAWPHITRICLGLTALAVLLTLFTLPKVSLAGGDNLEGARPPRAASVKARDFPDSPLAMAVRLERLLAQGAGILLPFPETTVKQDGGVIPLEAAQAAFPPEFLESLVPETVGPATVWRVTLRVDDDSGDVIFRNADNEPFWLVEADPAVYRPEWVALHRSTSNDAADFQNFFASRDPDMDLSSRNATGLTVAEKRAVRRYRSAWSNARQYLRPSHVELTFTFALRGEMAALRAARRAAQQAAQATPRMAPAATPPAGLAFTSIAFTPDALSFGIAWPGTLTFADNALDLFHARSLATNRWAHLLRVTEVEHSAGGLEIDVPRAMLPLSPDSPPPATVTNITPSAYDPALLITNIITTNAVRLADAGFFRLADAADSDGDGLSDAAERWAWGTDPSNADTDGDGMPDGWEVENGLDPLNAADGAQDADNDGLTNAEEHMLGTDPLNPDSDGDGLGDGEEASFIGPDAPFHWFDVTGGADLTPLLSNLDDGCADASLPFPITVDNVTFSNLSVNANGVVGLYAGQGSLGRGHWDNRDLRWSFTVPSSCGLMVAGFWDDLIARPVELGSAITLADVYTNDSRYCVIEYKNMGFAYYVATTSSVISLQIIFEENISNRLWLAYQDVSGYGDGRSATLGAVTAGQHLQFSCNTAAVSDNLALSYKFGTRTDPLDPDTDGDGLSDGDEVLAHGTDPLRPDTDGDGLSDSDEVLAHGTDPLSTDTDHDGLDDFWEVWNAPEFDPLDPSDGLSDHDGDGLTFAQEINIYHTDPNDWDTDGDGLSDGYEVAIGTSPRSWDTDYDGLGDGDEVAAGTNPLLGDTDGDGMPDGWEVERGFDPLDAADGAEDTDNDGLANAQEHGAGTDPFNFDTDGDGLSDGAEVLVHGTDPLDSDTDSDGLGDGAEVLAHGTDPRSRDTDNDGCPDVWEVRYGFDPLDAADPDPAADPDGDGLANLREARLGTNPFSRDTDGDGVDDNDEAGWISLAPPRTFDLAGGTDVLALISDHDDGSTVLPLPFPVEVQGAACSNVSVSVNGYIGLGQSVYYGRLSGHQMTLNAFYDDLMAYPAAMGSAIALADVYTNNSRYCVIEYKNMGFYYEGAGTNNLASFQIIFEEGVPDRVQVVYQDARGRGDGRRAYLSAQTLRTTLEYADHIYPAVVYPGLSLVYHLGAGTNPLTVPPILPDTDNDGLPDHWEVAHGMDPLANNDTDGIPGNGANDDPDGDGLSNTEEYLMGTDPFNADTDGDGVSDGDEVLQGSDPNDANDSQPREVVPVTLLFGDESGSHSEKYRVSVTPLSGDPRPAWTLVNTHFGRPDPLTVMLVANASYEVSLEHVDTKPEEWFPDYDYTLTITPDASYLGLAVIVDDPDGILGAHDESSYFYAAGKTARIVVVHADLVPDLDRDRKITGADRSDKPLYIWLNDDHDNGATSSGDSDIPADSARKRKQANFTDNRVNGAADLLDFFPVWLGVGEALGKVEELVGSGGRVRIRLRHDDDALSYVQTALTTNNAGAFLVTEIGGLAAAETRKITAQGAYLPHSFVTAIRDDPAKGVILLEGRAATSQPLIAEIWRNGKKICQMEMPLRVVPVVRMYDRVNLRDGPAVTTAATAQPPHNGKNVIFLHGFRVSAEAARGRHSEMFKRLWQSGSNARFHGVTWHGNYGAVSEGVLFYQQNAENAFQAAPHLAAYSAGLSGDKILMAHSLGNMVVSSAIADHSMTVAKFFMFNAAVAAEAFDEAQWDDATFQNPMLHEEWVDCRTASWSSKWYANFLFYGYPNDDRGRLTWKNRFASVLASCEVHNYYSSGDEVLALFTTPDAPGSDTITVEAGTGAGLGNHSWQKQERFKGRFGIDLWAGNAGTSWMGWGFADPPLRRVISGIGQHGEFLFTYEDNPATNKTEMLDYLLGNPIRPLDFFKCNVLFRGDPAEAFQPVIPQATQNAILAKGIPAMSGPVGSRNIKISEDSAINATRNVDMNHPQWRNGWPRPDVYPYYQSWLHSDIKDMAYPYNYKIFDDLVLKGWLK